MTNFNSRFWLPSAAVCCVLLLNCLFVVSLKAKNVIKEASIQEVFTGETHEFSMDFGQLAKIVPPTDYVATPPENHGPQYRTADWIKAQGSLAWTLQVFSSEDEDVVKSYLAQRDDKEQFAYFLYKEGDIQKYVVVYGNFVTMELALGVSNGMDFGLVGGVRASPEKFMTYVPHIPLIEQAIDRPPPVKYEGVPEVPVEPVDEPVSDIGNELQTQPVPQKETPVLDLF
ncbi:MAG: hypothetical protein H6996_03780 [Moraxellaceae bacterium]|nr:hypothetical protein [Moraxellaceae bacterium]MCP5176735.1 hypothetical protein [Moraxellaceae bacterium]